MDASSLDGDPNSGARLLSVPRDPLDAKPLKTGNFAAQDAKFEGAERYSDWKFAFVPRDLAPAKK